MAYFELAPLPFAKDGLEPWIDARAVERHYGGHHRECVEALDRLAAVDPAVRRPLAELVRDACGDVQVLAARAWSHDFFWRGLRPGGGGRPVGALLACLEAAFGGFGNCQRRLIDAALDHAGSGWAWLVLDAQQRLRVVTGGDADHPLRQDQQPLYAIDLCTHADAGGGDRPRYVRGIVHHLIDWDFVLCNLERAAGARGGGGARVLAR